MRLAFAAFLIVLAGLSLAADAAPLRLCYGALVAGILLGLAVVIDRLWPARRPPVATPLG